MVESGDLPGDCVGVFEGGRERADEADVARAGGEGGERAHRFEEAVHLDIAAQHGVGVRDVTEEHRVELRALCHEREVEHEVEARDLFDPAPLLAPTVLVVTGGQHECGEHHMLRIFVNHGCHNLSRGLAARTSLP